MGRRLAFIPARFAGPRPRPRAPPDPPTTPRPTHHPQLPAPTNSSREIRITISGLTPADKPARSGRGSVDADPPDVVCWCDICLCVSWILIVKGCFCNDEWRVGCEDAGDFLVVEKFLTFRIDWGSFRMEIWWMEDVFWYGFGLIELPNYLSWPLIVL